MNFDIINPEDSKWSDCLRDLPHDFYHLPEYIKFSAKYEGGEPCAFYASDEKHMFLAPLLIKSIVDSKYRDVVTPYGYPGPVLTSITEKEEGLDVFVDRALKGFKTLAKEKHLVAAFFRLHPLFELPTNVIGKHGQLIHHGPTVSINLLQTNEKTWTETRKGHRSEINQLRKRWLYTAIMDEWQYYDDFINLYIETMKRISAKSSYYFSKDYFYDLRTALQHRLHLCVVISPNHELAAAGIFIAEAGIIQYHLSGSSEKHISKAPTKLMIDHVRTWARNRGYQIFHLGGGVSAQEDSLYRFKAGFSRQRHSFYTFRMILDASAYTELNDKWLPLEDNLDMTYFPLYRQAMPSKKCESP